MTVWCCPELRFNVIVFKSGSYLFQYKKITIQRNFFLIYSTAVAYLVVSCIAQSTRPLNKPTYIPLVRNKGKTKRKFIEDATYFEFI